MSPLARFLLTLLLAACWSPSYLFMKLSVTELPPLTITAARVTLATMIFLVILLIIRQKLPLNFRFWIHASIMAIFTSVLPFSLFCYAAQSIDTAVSGVLNGTTPMFTALMAHFLLPTDRLNRQKVVGITLCTTGLIILFAPALMQGISGTCFGMFAALGAALAYAVGFVYARKYTTGYHALVGPSAQMLVASAIMLPLSFLIDNPLTFSIPSWTVLLSIASMAIFGTVIAFILYYRLIEYSGATASSLVTCLLPIGAMILGLLVLGEPLTLQGVIAAAFILIGMMCVNGLISVFKSSTCGKKNPV